LTPTGFCCVPQAPDETNTCVAGVEKNLLVLCRDRHGNPMKHGSKPMSMVVLDETGRPQDGAEASVKVRGLEKGV
jgi:hypothetical protein